MFGIVCSASFYNNEPTLSKMGFAFGCILGTVLGRSSLPDAACYASAKSRAFTFIRLKCNRLCRDACQSEES